MRILLFASWILFLTTIAAAQPNLSQATKFDEFGDAYPTDAAARLDNFATTLEQLPRANGFIIGYRSFRDLPGVTGRRINWMRSYLIHSRGMNPERIKAIDGGEASCLTHEFWVVPPGTAPTPRADAYSRGFDDLGVARKFDEYHFTILQDHLESYSTEYEGGLEGFAEALRKEPRSLAYLIAYGEYQKGRLGRRDPPGTALKELRSTKAGLVRALGISASRIRLVDGGYRNARAMELWIMPRGMRAPIPTPNVF